MGGGGGEEERGYLDISDIWSRSIPPFIWKWSYSCGDYVEYMQLQYKSRLSFIDFRVCDFAFAFKTQNAPCVSRFKRVLFSDRFQFAF